jgi:hypothetical protein
MRHAGDGVLLSAQTHEDRFTVSPCKIDAGDVLLKRRKMVAFTSCLSSSEGGQSFLYEEEEKGMISKWSKFQTTIDQRSTSRFTAAH